MRGPFGKVKTVKLPIVIIASFALLILLLVIGAGIALYLQFKPNSRIFIKDNIYMMGRLEGRRALYGSVEVGNPDQPYLGVLALSIRCGTMELTPGRTTVEHLMQVATRVSIANPESIKGGRWPDDARQLYLCDSSVCIVVSEDEMLQVVVSSRSCAPPVQVRTDRVTEWFAFPLSDEDAVSLFGTPDRVNDFFRH